MMTRIGSKQFNRGTSTGVLIQVLSQKSRYYSTEKNIYLKEKNVLLIRILHTYSMDVFPRDALRLEFNPDCDDMIFAAEFHSEDRGVTTPADSLFMLDDDLAGADIDKYRNLVPATLAQGVELCLERFGIKKNTFDEL